MLGVLEFLGHKVPRAAGQVKGQGLRRGHSRGRENVVCRVKIKWEKLLLTCPAYPAHARPLLGSSHLLSQ